MTWKCPATPGLTLTRFSRKNLNLLLVQRPFRLFSSPGDPLKMFAVSNRLLLILLLPGPIRGTVTRNWSHVKLSTKLSATYLPHMKMKSSDSCMPAVFAFTTLIEHFLTPKKTVIERLGQKMLERGFMSRTILLHFGCSPASFCLYCSSLPRCCAISW